MYGSRLGTFLTLLSEWDHKNVMWFDNFPEMWEESKNFVPKAQANRIGEILKDKLGLPMCMLDAEQSKFFKRHYNADKYNIGPLVREMDVIRRIEGW